MIQTFTPNSWPDYEFLDSGNGRKLERFGKYIISRPENQALWKTSLPEPEWKNAYAIFEKKGDKHGEWKKKGKEFAWPVSYKHLKFWVKLTPFGHTGVFPEQSSQWDWIQEQVNTFQKQLKILSLFTYTGISTLAAASAGASVTHVDASGPAITWARENAKLSGLESKPIRWIVEDSLKFVEREARRGNQYDAIIMDPPKFGRGAHKEVWKFGESIGRLLDACKKILSPQPQFILITAYAIPISSITLHNLLSQTMKRYAGIYEYGELALEDKHKKLISTALIARWNKY